MLKSLKNLFGRKQTPAPPLAPPVSSAPEPEEEIQVPGVTAADFLVELQNGAAPLILDIREQFEWSQVHVPATDERPVLHIPMSEVPARLDELPRDSEIVVMCAHGNRSWGVSHYLIEHGFQARNLEGGITQWHIRGGEVAVRNR